MDREKLDALKALAFLIEESNRVDPNPHVGQALPKKTKHGESN